MESKGESKSEGTYVRPLWPDDLVLDPGSSEEMPPEVEGIAPRPSGDSLDDMSHSFQALCRELAERRKSLDNDQRQLQIDRAEQHRLQRENEEKLSRLELLRAELGEWELRLKAMQAEQDSMFERRTGEIKEHRIELENRSEKLWQQMADLNGLVDVVNQVVTDEYGKLNEKGERIESLTKKLVDGGEVSRARMLAMGDATERRLSRLKRLKELLAERSQKMREREQSAKTREKRAAKQLAQNAERVSQDRAHANDELSMALRNACRVAIVLTGFVLVVGIAGTGGYLMSQNYAPPMWRASALLMFDRGGDVLLNDQMDHLKKDELLEDTFQRLAERGVSIDESRLSQRVSVTASEKNLIELNYVDHEKDDVRLVVDALGQSLVEHNEKSGVRAKFIRAAVTDREPVADDRLKHASMASGVAAIVMALFWIVVWNRMRRSSGVSE